MATVRQVLTPYDALFPASNPALFRAVAGTNFPVVALSFDNTTEQSVYFAFQPLAYGSGNITLRILWYAATATTGGVTFGASLAAITPDTDTQDVETDSFATEVTADDSHLGTTAKRIHEATLTLNQLDSVSAGDWCMLKLARKPGNTNDTMADDALVVGIEMTYSDT
jgi:hypothetical protein